MEQQKVLTRRHPVGYGLEKSLEAVRKPTVTSPITQPSSNVSPFPPPGPFGGGVILTLLSLSLPARGAEARRRRLHV